MQFRPPMKLRLIYKTQKNTKRVKIHVEPETTIKMLKKRNRVARITDQDDFELLDSDRLGNVLDDNEIIVCYNCSETEDNEHNDMNESEQRQMRDLPEGRANESTRFKKRNGKGKSVAAKIASPNNGAVVSQKIVRSEDVNEAAKENVVNRFSESPKGRHKVNITSSDRSEKNVIVEHLTPSPVKDTADKSVSFDDASEATKNNLFNTAQQTPINIASPNFHENSGNKHFRKIKDKERNGNRQKEQISDSSASATTKTSLFKSFGKRENEKKLTLDDL